MYRYYGIVRGFTGPGLALTSVAVYDDAAGTSMASIYDANGSALANPTTTNARGAIDVYSPRGELWYKVAGDTVVQPLPRTGVGPVINVRDYGAVGDGVTNDTDAVQAALDEAASYGVGSGTTVFNRPPVYFPPGVYLVDGFTIEVQNLSIVGAGRRATCLVPSGTTPIFSLGVFTTTPANAYVGTAQGFECRDLTFRDPDKDSWTLVGVSQDATAIQDNGSGGVKLTNVDFRGFLNGVYAPYGHDYCWYYACEFFRCTTALYYGPGTQQVNHFGTTFGVCGRDLLNEGGQHIAFHGCVFNDPKYYSLDLQRPDSLSSGVTTLSAKSELDISLYTPWFETGSWQIGWEPTAHIRLGSTSETYVVRGVHIYDAKLISGSAGMGDTTNHYFVYLEKGKYVDINGISIEGDYIDAVVGQPGGSDYEAYVDNLKTVDGYTDIPAFSPMPTSCRVGHNRDESSFGKAPRMFMSTNSSPPTTGYHQRGEICWNNGVRGGAMIGWVCTTSGTPGTWNGIGTVTDTGYSVAPSSLSVKPTLTIDEITAATAAVVRTTAAHGMSTGHWCYIAGTNSTPNIDGWQEVTVIDSTHFSVPVTTTGAGTTGTCQPTYRNGSPYPVDYIVRGGTVTKIEISRDAGANFTDTGLTAGIFNLRYWDIICITCSVAPTVRRVPKP